MPKQVDEKPKEVAVPSMVELAKKKNAAAAHSKKAKSKKASLSVIVLVVVVLLIIVALAAFFLVPKYKYSFNINGVDFVSNEYTPSEFFPQFRGNNAFLVVIDLKEGESNAWVVNSMNLWLVALNADRKSVQTLVRSTDAGGAILKCSTNDANIMSSRDLTLDQCSLALNDSSKARVIISLSNEDTIIMSKDRLDVLASGTKTVSHVNYFAIKEMYADFDKILALVNERINAIN